MLSLSGSGGGGGSSTNSFSVIQTDAGTSPTATSPNDTLTLTSSDSSVTITGNSTTDTVDFTVNSGSISYGFTPGSVIFADSAGDLTGNAPVFFYDEAGGGLRLGTNTSFAGDVLTVYPNQDASVVFGRTFLFGFSGLLGIVNTQLIATAFTDFAFAQDGSGNTTFNCKSGANLVLTENGSTGDPNMTITGSGGAVLGSGRPLVFTGSTSGTLTLNTPATTTSYTITLPSAVSAANDVMTFNGSATASFGKITNNNVDSSAQIALSKLANVTANRLLYGSSGGVITSETELFWDDSNKRLRINYGSSDTAALTIENNTSSDSVLHIRKVTSTTGDYLAMYNAAGTKTCYFGSQSRFYAATGTIGTSSAPSISFNGDTDTGFYLSASNTMVAVAGTVAITSWTSTYFTNAKPLACQDRIALSGRQYSDASANIELNHQLVHSDRSTTGTQTITMPEPSAAFINSAFPFYIIKDGAGNAGANNITISPSASETFDGASSLTINTNYGYYILYTDGSNWFIIGSG